MPVVSILGDYMYMCKYMIYIHMYIHMWFIYTVLISGVYIYIKDMPQAGAGNYSGNFRCDSSLGYVIKFHFIVTK